MTKKQVEANYYYTKKYASRERFISYQTQIDLIQNSGCRSVLFIGVGDRIVSDYFDRDPKVEITTVDIDPDLKPDLVADVTRLPFKEDQFDCVCAFEVLEHIPFEDFSKALSELGRVSKENVIISIPHRRSGVELVFKFPYIRSLIKRELVDLKILFPIKFPGFAVSRQHHWEIDRSQFPLRKIRSIINKNFEIKKELTPALDFYRRFFVLDKKL